MFNHFWIRFHGVYVALKAVYNIFNEKRIEKEMKIKMLHTCKQIKRNLKKRVARFGPDYDSRTQNLNRYGFNSVMIFLNEPVEIRARNVMSDFLTNSGNKYSVFTSFLKFASEADLISKFYKKRLQLRVIYKYILDKRWDSCFVNITQNNLLGKNKPKKVAKIMKKIYSISEDTKAKVLKLYNDHCTLKYRIWFIMYEEHQRQEIDR
jgi:hypothetical protein